MENKGESSLRLYLRLAVKLMLCLAVCGSLWVLLQSTGDRHPARKVIPSVAFEITDLQPGEYKTVVWANKPVMIMRRLPEWITTLSSLDVNLFRDPLSQTSVQPDSAANTYRSANREWFVAIALGTSMGCPLKFNAPSSKSYLGGVWPGGFVDSCDATRYDLAGRVFRQQAAKQNVVVPQWQLLEGNIVVGSQQPVRE